MKIRRQTPQKAAILRTLEREDRPLSPLEILELSRAEVPALGQATVYRVIKAFLDDGLIAAVAMPDGAPRYEVAGKEHHHHFQCRKCDRVYEIFACAGGISALTPKGFTLEDHEIMLFGRCATCAA